MNIALTIIGIAFLLIVNELWWRKRRQHSELSRKFVHITVGSFVAFWPFYLSWTDIRLLSLAFLLVVGISKKFNLFKAIHSVQRPTLGEIFFALSVGLVTFITQDKYIYTAALLQMSLADGAAAVIGSKYAANYKYKFLSHTKSAIGSFAFLVVSSIILLFYSLLAPGVHWSPEFLLLAIVVTIFENVSVYGLDNLTVPVIAALLLRL